MPMLPQGTKISPGRNVCQRDVIALEVKHVEGQSCGQRCSRYNPKATVYNSSQAYVITRIATTNVVHKYVIHMLCIMHKHGACKP